VLTPNSEIRFGGQVYDLKAIIFHAGKSFDSGHYTGVGKYGQRWYDFNDTAVTKLSKQAEIIRSKPGGLSGVKMFDFTVTPALEDNEPCAFGFVRRPQTVQTRSAATITDSALISPSLSCGSERTHKQNTGILIGSFNYI
jgi:Ubiquitin carboxyl-terminal hydrolase